MAEGRISMSQKESDRLGIIQSVDRKQLRQVDAALQLGLSVRQIKRLVQRFRADGAQALVSGHRGKRPGNAIAASVRQEVLSLIRESYPDFSPTFAHEKLQEVHGYRFCVETLRQWMISDGRWRAKQRKQARIHQRRVRRPCFGELIQIDGSPHDWFEGRAQRCTLIVFIDDATGQLMALRFVPVESTQAYMQTLRGYLEQFGRPAALYSDKHSIFRVNHPNHEGELTQFSRALKTLDIEPIHANTPQAKGRVERVNQTLQDRLIKEMRLAGINTLEEANAFVVGYIPAYNARFAVEPQNATDAHREVLHDNAELEQIFSLHHQRKLSKSLSMQFKRREYQIQSKGQGYGLRGATVTVCEPFEGDITVLRQGHVLPWRLLAEGDAPIPLDDEKSVHQSVAVALKRQHNKPDWKPAPDHPWNKMARVAVDQRDAR